VQEHRSTIESDHVQRHENAAAAFDKRRQICKTQGSHSQLGKIQINLRRVSWCEAVSNSNPVASARINHSTPDCALWYRSRELSPH